MFPRGPGPGCADCSFSSAGCVPLMITATYNIHDYELEPYLRRLKPTAPGLDAIPSCYFSKRTYELSSIMAYIFNFYFCNGMIPEQWKQSVVTHVPKVPRPTCSLSLSLTPFQLGLLQICLALLRNRWLGDGGFLP